MINTNTIKLNPNLKTLLEDYNIDYNEGVLYLLSLYFELNIDSVKFEKTIKQVNFVKLVERDYAAQTTPYTIKWNIALFENQQFDDIWDWVIEFRNMFKNIRPDRASTLNTCLSRMKNLFSKNPHIRKDDVLEATKMYLRTVRDPNFLISAHYFIKKDKGINEQSKLEEFLEIIYDNRKKANNREKML